MPVRVNDFPFDEVKARVKKALQSLEENDRYLFEHHASERALAYRLAVWLEVEFLDWHVDCHYNLSPPDSRAELQKHFEGWQAASGSSGAGDEAVSVHPDIVIHRRGGHENLLIIEVSWAASEAETRFDIAKLQIYKHDPFPAFKYALLLCFQRPAAENNHSILDKKVSRWVD